MQESVAVFLLIGLFAVMIICHLPVTFAMVIATATTMLYLNIPMMTMVQQMAKSVNSFSLLAIPFFILMGEIMGAGGISDRLLKFANVLVGRFRGGLAFVNVLASMFFGGISGSAVADVSSLGKIEIPMMEDAGYDKDFSICVTVSSACQGLLIPPSHNMVLYAMTAGGVSVGKLFLAGYAPGILLGVALMVLCYILRSNGTTPRVIPYRSRKLWSSPRTLFLPSAQCSSLWAALLPVCSPLPRPQPSAASTACWWQRWSTVS